MASKTFISNTYDGRYLQLKIEQVQDIANNKSTLNWTLSSIGGSVNYYSILATTIEINGTQVYSKGYTDWSSQAFPAAKGSTSGSITVTHNTDGSLTVPISFTTGVYSATYVNDYGGNFVLTKNPRAATIVSSPNFNDDDNPKITYKNTAGSAVTTLEIAIMKSDKRTPIAEYRSISKTGTSYTFNLTEDERTTLRKYLNVKGGSKAVYFAIKTKIDGEYYYSYEARTAYINLSYPILDVSAYDSGTISTQLTGNTSTLILGYNTLNAQMTATAQKEATIVSTSITNGSNTVNGSSAIFEYTEDSGITFSATDSRGFTTTKRLTLNAINYIKLTCALSVKAPTTDGIMNFSIDGSFFNGSFGAIENALTVQYRIKEDSGEFSEWTDLAYTIEDHKYTAEATLPGLNYRLPYTVQARAIDLAGGRQGIESNAHTVKTIPVFYWGKDSFNVTVPMTIEGNSLVDYVIEQGTEAMGSNGTWHWRKWASGKAECWGKRNYGNIGVSTAWGNLYQSSTFSQSLPSGLFIDTPTLIDMRIAHTNSGAGWIVTESSTGASADSTGSFFVCRATSLTLQQVYISFNIIGAWK